MSKTSLFLRSAAGALILGFSAQSWAQQAVPAAPAPSQPPPPEDQLDAEEAEAEVTVVGRRDPNAVIGNIPPENQLGQRDIRAYGASTVSELLELLAPQLGSSRGRGEGGQPISTLR